MLEGGSKCRRDAAAVKPGKKPEEEDVGVPIDFDQLQPQAQALELICRCDDVSDDAVELRLLKALLTAVTSSTMSVHGQALLLVRSTVPVRIMWNCTTRG